MISTWEAIDDDELLLAEKTVNFLQSEFCPAGVDPIWSEEYLRWKLSNINPAGSGYLSVALCDGRVIGTVSLTRKRILINGIEYMGGEVGDSYSSHLFRRRTSCSTISPFDSDPNSYINKSIFGRLASDVRGRAEEGGVSIIYGTPNRNAYPGWTKRLGYFGLTAYDNRSYVRPTVHFVTGKFSWLKPFCGAMYAAEAILLNIGGLSNLSDSDKKLSFEKRTPSEEEINYLWENVRPSIGFSLIRDASYWVHRYIKCPIASYSMFCVYKKEKIVGLIVTRNVTTGSGKVILYIVEWMINDLSVSLKYLLTNLIRIYRKDKFDAFTFYAGGSLFDGKCSLEYGFLKRNKVPIIFADTKDAQIVKNMNEGFQFYVGSSDAV